MAVRYRVTDPAADLATVEELNDWALKAKHGQRLIYARTQPGWPLTGYSDPGTNATRNAAWALAMSGLCALVQRRAEDGTDYIAERCEMRPPRDKLDRHGQPLKRAA